MLTYSDQVQHNLLGEAIGERRVNKRQGHHARDCLPSASLRLLAPPRSSQASAHQTLASYIILSLALLESLYCCNTKEARSRHMAFRDAMLAGGALTGV